MRRSSFLLVTLCVIGCIVQLSCRKEAPPEPYVRSIELQAVDASCVEAWLRVQITDGSSPPFDVRLQRDGRSAADLRLLTPDSVVVADSLLPNRTYTYKAYRLNDSRLIDSSTQLTLKTLDTTSHNFIFQIDTLGVTSSVLYDVAIISENDIWAVGELYLNDSSGQLDPILYNAAHWDGTRWDIRRITWQGYPAPIKFIFAYNENDIWFGMGYLVHWDGTAFTEVVVPPFYGVGSNKMWGSPSGELYVVGNSGTIAYSPDHGGTWQRVESGTNLHVQDIWGSQNKAGESEILAVAGNYLISHERKILRISGTTVILLPDSGINGALEGLWFSPAKRYWLVGDGIWSNRTSPSEGRWIQNYITTYVTNRIRGTEINNVFFCGAFGDCFHFNGLSWNSYRAQTTLSNGQYYSLATKQNLLIAVGYEYPRGVVLRGWRTP